MNYEIEMIGIRKEFPGVIANDDVNFSVKKGEIHALVGENGAGKSTLMNVLFGLYDPDGGTVKIRGEEVRFRNNLDAIAKGIGMVHQSFKLVPSFTVAENITLGHEPTKYGFTDQAAVRENVLKISKQFGLRVDPDARIRDLPVGLQQRVEILKALYLLSDILILDEPTGVLTPQETDDLFDVIRSLVATGITVIFITHKFREVMKISDRVTVLRDGKLIGTKDTKDTNPKELARMMVGREVLLRVDKTEANPQEVMLDVENLRVLDDRFQDAVRGTSLSVRGGEILGIAGVEGNGQRELVEAIIGIRQAIGGDIKVDGESVMGLSVRERRDHGICCVPEDRYIRGIAMPAALDDNLIALSYNTPPFSKGPVLDHNYISKFTWDLISEFDIRTPGPKVLTSTLSGGNIQKVVLAREICAGPKILLVAQPTRGLDVGSIEFVHRRILAVRDSGAAVLLVSAELEEVMSLCDRIAVLYEGEIVGIVNGGEATEEELGLLMAGIKPDKDGQNVADDLIYQEVLDGN